MSLKQNAEDYKIMFPQLMVCKSNNEEIVLENIKKKFEQGQKG